MQTVVLAQVRLVHERAKEVQGRPGTLMATATARFRVTTGLGARSCSMPYSVRIWTQSVS